MAKERITGKGVKPVGGGEKEGGGETGIGKGVVNRISCSAVDIKFISYISLFPSRKRTSMAMGKLFN